MFKKLILLALFSLALAETVQELNTEFQNDALFAHNLYRKIHGVPPLVLNPRLSQLALKRATELANAGELNVQQKTFEGQPLGETVGSVGGFSHYNGISATQLWYSVVSKFDEEGELSSEGASFTQIIWKKTRQVGFGIAKSKSGKFFFVGEYFPSGNIRHQYEDNVFQLTDEEILKGSISKPCPEVKTTDVWKKLLNKTTPTVVEKVEHTTVDQTVDEDVTTTISSVKLDRLVQKPTKAVKLNKPTATTVRLTTKPVTSTVLTTTVSSVADEVPVTKKPVKLTTTTVAEEVVEITTTLPSIRVRTTTPILDSPDLITVDDILPETTTLIFKNAKTTTENTVDIESTTERVVKTTTVLPKTTVRPIAEMDLEVTTKIVKTTPVVNDVEVEVTTKVVKTTPIVNDVEVEVTTKVVKTTPVLEDVTTKKIKTTTPVGEVEVDLTTKKIKTTTVSPVESDEVVDVTTRKVVATTVVPVAVKTTTVPVEIEVKTTKRSEKVETTTVEHVVVEDTTVKPVEHIEETTVEVPKTTTQKVVEKVVEKVTEKIVTTTPVDSVEEEVEKTTVIVPIKTKKNLSSVNRNGDKKIA